MSSPSRKPERVFRIGFVSASVFAHEIDTDDGGKRTLRSVNLQKRFLDGEEIKYTSSFNLAELPQGIRVLQLAAEYVESRESQVAVSE